jgi:hypothetical protein
MGIFFKKVDWVNFFKNVDWVNFDQKCDSHWYTCPINNAIDLVLKGLIKANLWKAPNGSVPHSLELNKTTGRFYKHLKEKDVSTCVLLMIPVFGKIFVANPNKASSNKDSIATIFHNEYRGEFKNKTTFDLNKNTLPSDAKTHIWFDLENGKYHYIHSEVDHKQVEIDIEKVEQRDGSYRYCCACMSHPGSEPLLTTAEQLREKLLEWSQDLHKQTPRL